MYLGSEVTCPACQQKDATIQLSLLVNQAKKELTVHQVEALTMAVQRGEAKKWERPPKGGSWDDLARLLEPPRKPEPTQFARMLENSSAWRWAFVLIGFIFLGTLLAFGGIGFEIGGLVVPLVCVVWIALGIAGVLMIWYVRDQEIKLLPRVNAWSEKMAKWNKLFYCGRDEQVFALGNPRHVAANQIKELIP